MAADALGWIGPASRIRDAQAQGRLTVSVVALHGANLPVSRADVKGLGDNCAIVLLWAWQPEHALTDRCAIAR